MRVFLGTLGLSCLLVIAAGRLAECQEPTPRFAFTVDGPCDEAVQIPGGSQPVARLEGSLTTSENPLPGRGAQGWTLVVGVTGAEVAGATTEGTVADLVENGGLRRERSLDLISVGEGPDGPVIVSAVVLGLVEDTTLPASGTQVVLLFDVESAELEQPGECSGEIRAEVLEFSASGAGEPFESSVLWEGLNVRPDLGACTLRICAEEAPREDCSDGKDNDGDSLADCEDPSCVDEPECACLGAGHLNIIFQETPAVGEDGVQEVTEVFANHAPVIAVNPGGRVGVYTAIVSHLENGLQGWSLSIALDGDAEIISATTDGTAGAVEPVGVRCEVSFGVTLIVDPSANQGQKGVMSAIVLGFLGCPVTLEPVGTSTVLAMELAFPEEVNGGLRCQDGLRGPSGRTAANSATVMGRGTDYCHCFETVFVAAAPPPVFIRGDSNEDGDVDIADVIWIVSELFWGGPRTSCPAAADANRDGSVDVSDALYIILYRLDGGAPPPAPFPDCGTDPEGIDRSLCPAGASVACA